MQFINIVVHSVEDMNFRVHLQYEFTKLGLDEYLDVSMAVNFVSSVRIDLWLPSKVNFRCGQITTKDRSVQATAVILVKAAHLRDVICQGSQMPSNLLGPHSSVCLQPLRTGGRSPAALLRLSSVFKLCLGQVSLHPSSGQLGNLHSWLLWGPHIGKERSSPNCFRMMSKCLEHKKIMRNGHWRLPREAVKFPLKCLWLQKFHFGSWEKGV